MCTHFIFDNALRNCTPTQPRHASSDASSDVDADVDFVPARHCHSFLPPASSSLVLRVSDEDDDGDDDDVGSILRIPISQQNANVGDFHFPF